MRLRKVLSLFDGMSCGQIALKEIGFKFDIYYASETDKHKIKQTQLNFPDTVQLGDVEGWRKWDINWNEIDLVLAGSPCQGFSFAGKQLAFDDPRSELFFVFVDILNYVKSFNPDVKFLLENVNMKREWLGIISKYCGVFPVNINSNLVSAQNRNRYYWTNIRTKKNGLFGDLYSDIPQPRDRGILLRDILEDKVDKKYYVSNTVLNKMVRRNYLSQNVNPDKPEKCLDKKHNNRFIKIDVNGRVKKNQDKASCFTAGAHSGGYHSDMDLIVDSGVRRLTTTECSRLQTIPFWYKWECSETQQYRMLGEGWTIEVIMHILSFLYHA